MLSFQETYEKICRLDNEEEIGYAYYQETGNYLDYMDLTYLLKQKDPFDFSVLSCRDAARYRHMQSSRLNLAFSVLLQEQFFIPQGANSEIQHLPRYIDITAHRHDFFEIVCTMTGQCLHCVEDKTILMQGGDITVIPPNVTHYLKAEPDCLTLTIKIRKTTFDSAFSVLMRSGTTLSAYFSQTLYSRHYQNSLTFHCTDDPFLPKLLLGMMAQQIEQKPYHTCVLDGLLATFFSYLLQNFEHTIEFASGDHVLNERMTAIENYMRQNYRTATLESTARHFYLSPAYLSTTIKKQTGVTFSKIMQHIKMEHAAQLLADTPIKIEQICESVGYQDTTQFIRTFKKYYGVTPHRYRKEVLGNK